MEFDSAPVGPPQGHLVESTVDGHINLYDPVNSRVHVLNGTASDAWLLSDGEHTAEQIAALLAEAYAIDVETIRSSVLDTVGFFYNEGLLTREHGAA